MPLTLPSTASLQGGLIAVDCLSPSLPQLRFKEDFVVDTLRVILPLVLRPPPYRAFRTAPLLIRFGGGAEGGGGGGGGATVLFVGSDLQAIAGGGAAGGGGGNNNVFAQNAPGTAGQAIQYTTNGQNGQDKSGDGGGGGGGGGGDRGGNGGATVGGDSGALAGAFGLSTGNVIADPVGRTPGNQSSVYYSGFAGLGGGVAQAGNGGYAVLEIEPDTVQVYQFGQWNPSTPYVNDQGVWKEVQGVFIYQSGEWKPVAGTNSNYAPAFVVSPVNENFGTNSRTTEGGNGGGGGGKIICNKLAQLGYFDPAMNAADQQFGQDFYSVPFEAKVVDNRDTATGPDWYEWTFKREIYSLNTQLDRCEKNTVAFFYVDGIAKVELKIPEPLPAPIKWSRT